MASEYYRVSPKYWINERRAWSEPEKLLGLYLLTCEHRNTEGLYRLPKGYICEDLSWPARKAETTLERLVGYGFVSYDEAAQVIFLPRALAIQRPTTRKQIMGAVRELERLPRTVLWEPFMRACDELAPRLADALRHGVERAFDDGDPPSSDSHPDGHANGHSNGHSNGSGKPFESHAHAHSSSSSSSSSSIPPKPPEGGRRRDRDLFEQEMTAWAAAHFPGAHQSKVAGLAVHLRSIGVEPTADAMRDYAATNPMWSLTPQLHPVEPSDQEARAA